MVDVLTKKNGMYSGLFTSYVPEGDTVSAIALEYALHFSSERKAAPSVASPNVVNSSPFFSPMVSPKSSQVPSRRERRLIKNNGEMVIPLTNVENLHFWEIRRGFKYELGVTCETERATVEQYGLLSVLFPGFIREISIYLKLPDELQRRKFLNDFSKFAVKNGIRLGSKGIVKIMVPKLPKTVP